MDQTETNVSTKRNDERSNSFNTKNLLKRIRNKDVTRLYAGIMIEEAEVQSEALPIKSREWVVRSNFLIENRKSLIQLNNT